MAIIRNVR